MWKLSDGRNRLWGNLDLALVGGATLSKSLIQLSVDGWGCVPSQLFGLKPNHGRVNGDLLQKDLCQTAEFNVLDSMAGHCQPTPLLVTPGHAQTSLVQSLVGSLLLSPGSWCAQGFVCAVQEYVSLVLWKFCNQIPLASKVKCPGGSQSLSRSPDVGKPVMGLELSQQCENSFDKIVPQSVGRLLSDSMVGHTRRASHVCCSQSPYPNTRPLLTDASTGDIQTLKGKSGSVSCGVPASLVPTRFCLSHS